MAEKKRFNKAVIWIAAAAVILIGGYTFYRIKKSDFMVNKFPSLVNDKSNHAYKISYDSVYVDEAAGILYIKNLVLLPDTTRQMQLIAAGDTTAKKMLLDIRIPELKVEGFKTAKALLSKRMDCEQVIITNPVVTVYLFPGQENNKETKEQQKELYKQILGDLKLIKAQKIAIINGTVNALDFITKEKKIQGNGTMVNLTDVAIDSTYNQDTSRIFFCKEIEISIAKAILGDKANTAEASGLLFDTRSKIISLASFDYDSYKNKGFFKTSLKGIAISGADYSGPVENSSIHISSIVINSADLDALSSSSESSGKQKKSGKILTGWIKQFSLDNFNVKTVSYTAQPVDKKEPPFTLNNNSLQLKNVRIDRSAELNESLFEKAGEIDISNDEIKINSTDGKYTYRFAGLRMNTRLKKVFAKSIEMIPRFNEVEFAKKSKYQVDRYDLNFKNLVCNNVDFGKLLKNELQASNITTSNNSIKVYRDISYPIDSIKKNSSRETFPHQLLHKLSLKVEIKKFTATNTNVEYKEKSPLSNASGKVKFSNTTLNISNISNFPAQPGEKMIVEFSSSFLDKIPITGAFTFYNDKWRGGNFKAEALVQKPFDATLLNALTQPMAMARIEKGTISRVDFKTMADSTISNGELKLSYNDLKVSLLKKKGNNYAKKDVLSFIANLLVKNKNKQSEDMRTANVKVERNHYKSFFNYIWMTIFKGMAEVLILKL